MVMTRSGMSQEELRIVEGQGQSSEVITPLEELNRINEMGATARTFHFQFEPLSPLGNTRDRCSCWNLGYFVMEIRSL